MIVDARLAFKELRPVLLKRAANTLARGSLVRADFQQELNRFFDLLEQCIATGDAGWVEPLLREWAATRTEANPDETDLNVTALVRELGAISVQITRENLEAENALELLEVIVPIFYHSLETASRCEHEAHAARLISEVEEVRRRIEKVERSKSNFVSIAAHELKTPLTLVDGYTAMLKDSLPGGSDQAQMLLEGIRTGIQRLHALIDDMIDISLLENNLMAFNAQPVWPGRILQLLKTDLQGTLDRRRQQMEIIPYEGANEFIYGDPERLYQAFKNILNNSIKYTPDGGRITASGRSLPGFVEITIADTGIGIAPENQESIFQKFGQVGSVSLHSSGKTKFKGGGAGLGLPIAKGIIEGHGGTIWVESERCDETACPGSIFHILLPLRPPQPETN